MSDDTTTEATTEVDKTTPAPEHEHETANSEAKKYRLRLRDTEVERDQLAGQVAALRRSAVEDRLKGHRVPAAGFWAAGIAVDDLIDDDGNLDDDKIKTAADDAVKTLGLERVGSRAPIVPSEGRVTNPSRGGMTDALRPR